jgi:hypothetical protein
MGNQGGKQVKPRYATIARAIVAKPLVVFRDRLGKNKIPKKYKS